MATSRGEQEKKREERPKAEPRNAPSAVEGKGKPGGPEDMDTPGAGPRQRTD